MHRPRIGIAHAVSLSWSNKVPPLNGGHDCWEEAVHCRMVAERTFFRTVVPKASLAQLVARLTCALDEPTANRKAATNLVNYAMQRAGPGLHRSTAGNPGLVETACEKKYGRFGFICKQSLLLTTWCNGQKACDYYQNGLRMDAAIASNYRFPSNDQLRARCM